MKSFYQNWRQLLSVQVGGAICLPIIMIGQVIGQMFGFIPSIIAIGLGNLFLMGCGIKTAMMSVEKRKSTSEIAVNYFGKKGAKFFSSLLCFSMTGWFGIQLNFITQSVLHILAICNLLIVINPIILNIGLGILMTIGALFGIRGIRVLSIIVMPLLIAVLIFSLFLSPLSMISLAFSHTLISLQGISMVIGGAIAAIIDFPTYFQHAKSKKDGIITVSLLFGFFLPLIEIVGVCLGVCFPHSTLLNSLISKGGIMWSLFVCLFLIFAGWTTNNTNIYSAAVNSKRIFLKLSDRKRTIAFGLLGTFLSIFGLLSHLVIVLTILGIFLTCMGGASLSSYLMDKILKCEVNKKDQIYNLLGYALAVAVALLSFFHVITLTYLPILDGFIIAFAAASIFRLIGYKKLKLLEIHNETNTN
ncbi:MAG: hypothetical protein JXA94_05305 [Parachlamydiales bacterium]|nr:hypothetical protein [Parachlamydiales bacterium]